MVPSKKVLTELSMNGNKLKNVGLPVDSTDGVNKAYVDDKTSDIYTSVADDFNDTTKIGTNNSVVVDTANSLVRPSVSTYVESFSDTQYNEQLTSNTIDVSGGVAKVYTGSVGYNPLAITNSDNLSILQTEEFDVSGAEELTVTPTFTTPSGITGHTSPAQALQIHPSSTSEHLSASANLGTVDFVASYFIGTGNNSVLKVKRIDYSTNTTTEATIFSNGTYSTAQSDTNIKQLAMFVDQTGLGLLYVAYPISTNAGYAIVSLDSQNLTVNGTMTLDVTGLGSTPNIQGIDLAYYSNALHIIACVNTSTQSSVLYSERVTNVSGPSTFTFGTSNELIKYPNTTDKSYKARFAKRLDSYGNLGWAAFTRKTSVPVNFGIIVPATGTQYRTSPTTTTATTPNIMKTGCLNIAGSCNGNGNIVYDHVNFMYYIFWVRGGTGDISFTRIGTGQTDTASLTSTITAVPYDTATNRDICGVVDTPTTSSLSSTTRLNIFYANTTRQTLTLARVNIVLSTGVASSVSTTTLFRDASATNVLAPIHVVSTSNSLHRYRLYFNYLNNVDLIEYKSDIQPVLRVGIRGANDSLIAGTSVVTGTSGNTITFEPTNPVNSVSVRFEFFYPILSVDFTGTNRSIELSAYTLSKTLPIDTNPTTSSFISIPLVTDRIVRSVTLDVTQEVGSGNSISWEVASLGDNWQTISASTTPAWTVEFPEGQYGSQLRVKATLNKGAGNNTVASVPKIQKYVANVKNVVTVSDIYPMQMNILKLGLQINTLQTANRWGYKNMMIDVFQTDAGVEAYSPTFDYNSGVFTNTTVSPAYLTSTVEPADITTVRNIVVVGDGGSGVTYEVRRGSEDTWVTVTPETMYSFQTGTPTDELQIRALVPGGGTITGWAYLYA
jgi:hypothetical protein